MTLPGVQVLFAFLLVLPFQRRFEELTGFEEKVYFATLLCTALASSFLIAPPARHRLRFRREDKAHVVLTANRLAIAGFAFLGLGIVGAILLVSELLFGTDTAIPVSAAVALLLAWVWFASPLLRDLRRSPGGAPRRLSGAASGR